MYIILNGEFAGVISRQPEEVLGRTFAALEDNTNLEREIIRLGNGEIIGEMSFLDLSPAANSFMAIENSLVLGISSEKLRNKLKQDVGFAARFYRAIAILLSGRIQGLISRLGFGKGSYQFGQSLSADTKYEDEIDVAIMDNIFLGGARFDWMLKRLRVI